ncbi:MAG TPA: phosphotransferase [Verrucomicrobiae bacterium]|nr:phosphotransferase [Verrucomicrobiae bacterium]
MLLVKGHSGFGVELVDELTIRKSAPGTGGERLKRQIEKQISFYEHFQQDSVRTPKILRTVSMRDKFYADMEFIAAKDFVQFLSEADRRTLDDFVQTVSEFIRRNLKSCRMADVSESFLKKLAELKTKKVPARYLKLAEKLCRAPVLAPVGPCHGDLTLSNILFKTDHLYLLDFLDCFVESPLQDIVKLRQDTHFGWSLRLYQAEFNWARMQIAFGYLDKQIDAAFGRQDWYARHYFLFQFVNLMRVLPYCTGHATRILILDSLERMFSEFQFQTQKNLIA